MIIFFPFIFFFRKGSFVTILVKFLCKCVYTSFLAWIHRKYLVKILFWRKTKDKHSTVLSKKLWYPQNVCFFVHDFFPRIMFWMEAVYPGFFLLKSLINFIFFLWYPYGFYSSFGGRKGDEFFFNFFFQKVVENS